MSNIYDINESLNNYVNNSANIGIIKSFYDNLKIKNINEYSNIYNKKVFKIISIILMIILLIPNKYKHKLKNININTNNLYNNNLYNTNTNNTNNNISNNNNICNNILNNYYVYIIQNILCTIIPYLLIFTDQLLMLIYSRENIKLMVITLLTLLCIFMIHYYKITNIIQSFGTGFIRHSIFYSINSNTNINNINSNTNINNINSNTYNNTNSKTNNTNNKYNISDMFLDYVYSTKHRSYKIYIIYITISIFIYVISNRYNNISNIIKKGELVTYLIVNIILLQYKINRIKYIMILVMVYIILLGNIIYNRIKEYIHKDNRVIYTDKTYDSNTTNILYTDTNSCKKRILEI